jgi:hypothetical protein
MTFILQDLQLDRINEVLLKIEMFPFYYRMKIQEIYKI